MSMRPCREQLERVIAAATPLPAREVPLADALGLRLAAPAHAACDLPGFDNSAMDGYAVRRTDVAVAGTVLRVVADVPAGSGNDPELATGECARIMTGAPVPTAADAVVPLEATTLGTAITPALPETIEVTQVPALGAHIRRQGEDIHTGEIVAEIGTRIGARSLSALAAAGIGKVSVHPRPRVATVSTGDELVVPGSRELQRGEIFDSNSMLLAGLVAEAGAELVGSFHSSDAGDGFLHTLEQADAVADVIITTGGVSVGAFDVVRLELERSQWQVEFAKIAMQPGKPQGFGTTAAGGILFALPGNPVSVFASFEAFVRPALRRLAGERDAMHDIVLAEAGAAWRTSANRTQLMPVRFTSEGRVVPATDGGSRSHLVARLAAAEGLAVVPAECAEVVPGQELEVWKVLA